MYSVWSVCSVCGMLVVCVQWSCVRASLSVYSVRMVCVCGFSVHVVCE